MSKTNPSGYRPATWTTDEFIPPNPENEPNEPNNPNKINEQHPTPFQLASVILAAIRAYPDAYQAMLTALETFWPVPTLQAI